MGLDINCNWCFTPNWGAWMKESKDGNIEYSPSLAWLGQTGVKVQKRKQIMTRMSLAKLCLRPHHGWVAGEVWWFSPQTSNPLPSPCCIICQARRCKWQVERGEEGNESRWPQPLSQRQVAYEPQASAGRRGGKLSPLKEGWRGIIVWTVYSSFLNQAVSDFDHRPIYSRRVSRRLTKFSANDRGKILPPNTFSRGARRHK